jgi:hypothetical protein
VQFLEVIRSAHLVLDNEENDRRVVSIDMHLFDIAEGRCCTVTCGVGREEEKRRGTSNLENPEMWLVAGRGLTVTRRGRARPEAGVGAFPAKNNSSLGIRGESS